MQIAVSTFPGLSLNDAVPVWVSSRVTIVHVGDSEVTQSTINHKKKKILQNKWELLQKDLGDMHREQKLALIEKS